MRLHDRFHGVYSLICHCVCVLGFLLEEGAASFFNAFFVAGHTSRVGSIALHTCNLNAFNLVPAGCLCFFNCFFCAHLRSLFIAGTNKRDNLVRVDVGIQCNNRLIGRCNLCRYRIRLQRSDNIRIITAAVDIGVNHVGLFIVGSLRRRALDINLDARIVLLVLFTACLDELPVLGCLGLEDDTDLQLIAGRTGTSRLVSAGTAASAQACQHSACQKHRCKTLHFHNSSPFLFLVDFYSTALPAVRIH